MSSLDRATLREWLSLELDDALDSDQRRQLHRHLESDPELRRERASLARLDVLLTASRAPVRAGFAHQVVSSLPVAGWEARHPRSWRLAVALLLLLGGGAAALVGVGSARLMPGSPFLGAVGAVMDLFTAAALTGAGLLAASWKGLGLALGQLAAGSTASLVAFAVLVVCLNLLFVMLLRGKARAAVAATRGPQRGGRARGRR